ISRAFSSARVTAGLQEGIGGGHGGRWLGWSPEVAGPQSRANRLPKLSYWLDPWLFILFGVMVFFFACLLP
uniref:Uncharacterized protein n=1 Tax=Piliocolobus tephrosceles TaxID=591936 RepID=A0A8C9HL14_9PRIM